MTKKATLIVGHGSRYEYNKKIMELQKERLEKMGFENVYIGFNETSHPFIGETMEQMAADGIEEVVAIPFFIASGLHMTRDIPPKLGLKDDCKDMVESVDGHEMIMHFGEPFGEDPLLAKILGEKIDEAKKCKRTGVLVIGHGSKLHYNKDIISLNAKRLTDMGYDDVLYAFNEFNEPTIEDVLEEIHLRGQSDEGVHTAFAAGDIDFVGYAGEVIARVGRVLRECHDCLAAEPEVCESLAELLNLGNSS